MKNFFRNNKVSAIINALLVFFLAICIVGSSMTALIRFTAFNPAFMTDSLNESRYYADLCDEVKDELVYIGDASGLDREFFDEFVDELMVREDVQSYVDAFYSGKKLEVDTSNFEKQLRSAIEAYEIGKGINTEKVNQDSVDYFVKEAAKVYSGRIRVSYLSILQDRVRRNTPKYTILMLVLAAIAVGIILLMLFTERWKHKAVRRIYYSFTAAGLVMLLIPIAVFASGLIDKINFVRLSAKEMYVTLLNTFFSDVLTIAVTLLVIAAALCVTHLMLRKKASQ